jgi:hypothetical protein
MNDGSESGGRRLRETLSRHGDAARDIELSRNLMTIRAAHLAWTKLSSIGASAPTTICAAVELDRLGRDDAAQAGHGYAVFVNGGKKVVRH